MADCQRLKFLYLPDSLDSGKDTMRCRGKPIGETLVGEAQPNLKKAQVLTITAIHARQEIGALIHFVISLSPSTRRNHHMDREYTPVSD